MVARAPSMSVGALAGRFNFSTYIHGWRPTHFRFTFKEYYRASALGTPADGVSVEISMWRHSHAWRPLTCRTCMRLSSHHFRSELRSPRRHSAQSSIAAMPQLTTAELNLIDRVVRVQKHSGADACRAVNATRAKKSIEAVSITSVHKYIKGVTHARGRVDGRGKNQNIPTKAHVKKLLGARRRNIQKGGQRNARDLCRGH
jgi:hypothetical protein